MIRTISEKALKNYARKVVARRRGFSLTEAYQMFPMKYFLKIVYYITLIQAEQTQKQLLNNIILGLESETIALKDIMINFNKLEKELPQMDENLSFSDPKVYKYLQLQKNFLETEINMRKKMILLSSVGLRKDNIEDCQNIIVNRAEILKETNLMIKIIQLGGQA